MKTLLPISLILLLACNTKSTNENVFIEDLVSDSLYFQYVTFEQFTGDCDTDTAVYCTKVILQYPIIEKISGSPYELINIQLEKTIINSFSLDSVSYPDLRTFAKNFIEEYNATKSDFGESFGWYALLTSDVLRNDSTLLVIELNSELYTGGAHGSYVKNYLNFNPASGKLISFKDYFIPQARNELNKILADRKMAGMLNFENFAILEDTIFFYFNETETIPYTTDREVGIVRDSLDHLIN